MASTNSGTSMGGTAKVTRRAMAGGKVPRWDLSRMSLSCTAAVPARHPYSPSPTARRFAKEQTNNSPRRCLPLTLRAP